MLCRKQATGWGWRGESGRCLELGGVGRRGASLSGSADLQMHNNISQTLQDALCACVRETMRTDGMEPLRRGPVPVSEQLCGA